MSFRSPIEANTALEGHIGGLKRQAFEHQRDDLMKALDDLSDMKMVYLASAFVPGGIGASSGLRPGSVNAGLDHVMEQLQSIDLDDTRQDSTAQINTIYKAREMMQFGDIHHQKTVFNISTNILAYGRSLEFTTDISGTDLVEKIEQATENSVNTILDNENSAEKFQQTVNLATSCIRLQQLYNSRNDHRTAAAIVESQVLPLLDPENYGNNDLKVANAPQI